MLIIIIISAAAFALAIWALTDILKYRAKARRCRKAREQEHAAMPLYMRALSNNLPNMIQEEMYLRHKWESYVKAFLLLAALVAGIITFIAG